ncbi:hypothetical protein GG344DRAFT_77160 [Lentinula edodes]|nr:hypothetical protein GG344DRAFT_77160 [Lentinula edodes]
MDHSLCLGRTISRTNNPISTTNLQTTEFANRHSQSARTRPPYDAATRRASIYSLSSSLDDTLGPLLPPTSSSPERTKPPPPSPWFTASHLSFLKSTPPCYKRTSPSSAKIPKPPGEVGRPGRGGYNLRKTLGWSKQDYDDVKVRT